MAATPVPPAGSQCGWLAKHVPDSVDSLAMHKKKVEEICGWLELQKQPGLGCQAPRMLILSGALLWGTLSMPLTYTPGAHTVHLSPSLIKRRSLAHLSVAKGSQLALKSHWIHALIRACGSRGRGSCAAGPTGCGKSTALQVLAKEQGFVLCEWQPPVPTLWHEHRYQVQDYSFGALGCQSLSLTCQLGLNSNPHVVPFKKCATH